jgi:hypothetical protein
MSVFAKLSSNVLHPTFISNFGIELCEVVKNNVTLMLQTKFLASIYPAIYDVFKDYIHPCPYTPARYVIRHVVDQLVLPDFVQPYEYKVLVRGEDRNNRTIGQGFGMITVKKGFPVGRKPNKRKN